MGKSLRRPGLLASVSLGRHSFAISPSVLLPISVYMVVVWFRLKQVYSDMPRPGGYGLLSVCLTVFGIPLVISVITGLICAGIARFRRREMHGFAFTGATMLPVMRVSPSRPGGIVDARPYSVIRIALLGIAATWGVAVAHSQMPVDGTGPSQLYWVGAMAISWSLIALPPALLDLVAGYLWPAPTPQARGRRFRVVTRVLGVLMVVCLLGTVSRPPDPSGIIFRLMVGEPLLVGLMLAILASRSVAMGQRAPARDLRQAAVKATVLSGDLRAAEALSDDEAQGFLVADQQGQLAGWLSRDDALRSPDLPLVDLVRPLLDPVPIEAVQHVSDLVAVVDPYLDGGEVVALSLDGTPVGYIAVSRAFEYVTGKSA